MKIEQGDIVEVCFLLPDNKTKPHPTIVISSNVVNEYEDAFIGVMLSSSAPNDEFTYTISNKMLTKPAKKACQVRTQLISLIPESQILGKHGRIKKKYLKEIIDKIYNVVLEVE